MNRQVRRKLEMAVSVRDFSRSHPSDDQSLSAVLARLEEGIARTEALIGQQLGGFLIRHSSTVRRGEIKRRLRSGMLRHLVTIAEDAAVENPELTDMFQLPSGASSNKAFQTLSRKMLEQGKAHKDVLMKHGLSERLLDDLDAALGELDASLAETVGGRQNHVLAGAELRRLSEELVRLVRMMDGINRYRFEHEPQLLVAWESAKHIVAGPQTEATDEKPAPSAGPAFAPPGEVSPAA
ncbi:MAG TPA: hypothetical protein VF046_00675 [Gemmatimonadales bacterium]